MKSVYAILFIILVSSFANGQKTRSVVFEIHELEPPELLLPTEVNTFTLTVKNLSEYEVNKVNTEESFPQLVAVEQDGDLDFHINIGVAEITDFVIEYDHSDYDERPYKATLKVNVNSDYGIYYDYGGFNFYRGQDIGNVEISYRVFRSEINEQDGKYYFNSLSSVHKNINNWLLNQAVVNLSSYSQKLKPKSKEIVAVVYTVSDRKNDYSKIEESTNTLQEAYNMYVNGIKEEAKLKLLNEAKNLRSFLNQADFNDKKAFINAKVAAALIGNLAYAYEFSGEYGQALEMLALIDKEKIKLPGGFYYNPIFIEEWRQRINELKSSSPISNPQIQSISVELKNEEKHEDLMIKYINSEPYDPYTMSVLSKLDTKYFEKELVGFGIEKWLYGNEARMKIKELYGLDSIRGIRFINYTENGRIRTLRYRIMLNQEVRGNYYVVRILDENMTPSVEIALPEKSILFDEIYHQFELQDVQYGTTFKFVLNKQVASYDGALKALPKDFPLAELKRSRIEYDLSIDGNGSLIIEDLNEKELKTKIDVNLISLREMRIRKRKNEFLKMLSTDTKLDTDLKNKLSKRLQGIDENYFFDQ